MESHSSFIPTLTPGESYFQITKTRLDLTITQSTFDQGKRAFNQRQYDQAIDYYTQALQALHQHVVSIILLHRAAAYEMDNKFDEAKQDCEYALAHAEATCPDVYFSYGSACYFTDHWNAALAAYRDGIAKVPQDIPQHTALVQKHDRLAEQVDQRNQKLVRKLPFEVVHNILSRVSMVDRMQFAQTCRFWNRLLMHEYPNMWYEINGTDLTKPINTTIDWIPQHCVKKVVLDLTPTITIRYDGEAYDDNEKALLLRFLSNKAHTNDWTNLHLLRGSEVILNTMHKWKCIETLDISNYDNEQLRKSLQATKESLKRLTLRRAISRVPTSTLLQSLADVVRISRNLQHLTFHDDMYPLSLKFGGSTSTTVSAALRTIFTTALDSSPTLSLTHLALSNEIPVDLLAQLLALCPKLAMLNLTYWSGQSLAQVLNLIHANCPLLRVFTYGDQYQALPDPPTLPCPDDSGPGLQTISISPLRAENRTETFTELESLFRRNRNTLLHLVLGNTLLGAYKCRILKLAADQGLPHLQTLYTWHNNELDEKRLCALLKACPSLESVALHNQIPPNYQNLLESLGELPKLKHLDIQSTWEHIPVNKESTYFESWRRGMKSLFQKQQCLHTFVYGAVQDPPKDLETPLAKTIATLVSKSSVQKLDLHWLDLYAPEGLNTLLKGLKNSQVRELIVGADFAKATPRQLISFGRLASIPHLNFFKVCNRGAYFDAEDVEVILDEHQNPQTLVVWFDSERSYVNGCKFADDSDQGDENDPVKRYHIQVKSKKDAEPFRRHNLSCDSSDTSSD